MIHINFHLHFCNWTTVISEILQIININKCPCIIVTNCEIVKETFILLTITLYYYISNITIILLYITLYYIMQEAPGFCSFKVILVHLYSVILSTLAKYIFLIKV